MKTLGYNHPLYILPFDHRGSFETKLFGWHGDLTPEQTAEIAAAKQVIYEGFKAAVAEGVPKEKAGILDPEAIAENYWQLHRQPRSAWTHELDLRPWMEPW